MISVRTNRIVHGVASEGCSFAFRSGSERHTPARPPPYERHQSRYHELLRCADAAASGSRTRHSLTVECRFRIERDRMAGASFGRRGHQNPSPSAVDQRQRLPRRQRQPRSSNRQPAASAALLPCATIPINQPSGCRTRSANCFLHPCRLAHATPRYPHRQLRLHHFEFAPRQPHSRRPPAADRSRGSTATRSTAPGASASRFRTRKLRTGTATSSSTGSRATRGAELQPSSFRLLATSAALAPANCPRPDPLPASHPADQASPQRARPASPDRQLWRLSMRRYPCRKVSRKANREIGMV